MRDTAMDETLTVSLEADTTALDQAFRDLETRARSFGNVLTGALKGAVLSGKSLEDTLRGIGLSLAGKALDNALQPLSALIDRAFSSVGAAALGGSGSVAAFADGGVVAAPTYFATRGGLGLMGEAGAEAILPLSRGPDGRLGVAASGGGAAPTIVFNVSTPDAASFAKSEGQIQAMLARAARRGQRMF